VKFLVCQDIHARNKPEGMLALYRRLIRSISVKAIAEGCPYILFGGDLIHEKHAVLVELLIMLFMEFAWARKNGVNWILIPGNHDIPAKHTPTTSILYIFSKVAFVYLRPKRLKGPGWSVYLNPWRLPGEFKKNSAGLAKLARSDDAPFKLQIAHIGLAEGVMSPSNSYRVPSPVRVPDLYPEQYTMTILGDYHSQQQLHHKLMYGGAPIAHIHGDVPNQGVWVVDTKNSTFTQVDLPGEWPEFITMNLDKKQDLFLEPKNHYRLRVVSEMWPYYNLKYGALPNVKVEEVAQLVAQPTARRLEGVNEGDLRTVLQIWLKQKGFLDPEYMELGDHYLNRAEQWFYEHRA
jgi:DNA repair exonuclease SbcCD nuclease subunit